MFEPNSRYADIETTAIETPDGREVVYKRRRFVPAGERMRTLTEVTVTEGGRLDLITARTLGDPEQFWRIADANDAMNPADLEEVGWTLRIPVPEATP